MIDEKKLIRVMWDRYNEHYNNANRFSEEETEMAYRVLSDLQLTIENMPEASEWIPCSKDLPKQDGEYLVTCLGYKDNPYVCTLYYGYVNENDDEMCFHEWDDDMWDCWKPDVIAWMPKPKPYKPIK